MMHTYFVLYLFCLTCQPMQIITIHDIPAYSGGTTQWADLNCKRMGDILSGDYDRRNMKLASPIGRALAKKDWILYSCKKESGEF